MKNIHILESALKDLRNAETHLESVSETYRRFVSIMAKLPKLHQSTGVTIYPSNCVVFIVHIREDLEKLFTCAPEGKNWERADHVYSCKVKEKPELNMYIYDMSEEKSESSPQLSLKHGPGKTL